jgi:hypothetical protein
MDGSPGWEIVWQQAPRTPGAEEIEDRVEDFAQIHGPGASPRLGRRQQRREEGPLGICQIGGIGEACHSVSFLACAGSSHTIAQRGDFSHTLLGDILESLNIRREFLNDAEDQVPDISTASVVIAGGPGSSETSVDVNQRFSTEKWFSGFWFHTDDPDDEWGWVIHHRALEEVSITMADISDMPERKASVRPPNRKLKKERRADDRPPYQKLQDGENQDYGLIFAGPSPANPGHWLVYIAGLRGMGTFAAARAFYEPPIVEIIARELLLRRRYISAMVRYRFLDQDGKRFLGHISSVCLTTGMVPES